MVKIKAIHAREILNAKGNPSIETTVILSDDTIATASSPSGTSIGSYEAVEVYDGDMLRFRGLGAMKASTNIEKIIAPKLIDTDVTKQSDIDKILIELDGTQNKSKLGTNATTSVSMAIAKAAAMSSKIPLYMYLQRLIDKKSSLKIPTPLFNILNGGLHAPEGIDFQECIVIPATFTSYMDALHIGVTIYFALKDLIKLNGFSTLVGDEGGFSPAIKSNYNAFSLIKEAIETTKYRLGYDVYLGIDAAANTFYNKGEYHLQEKTSRLSAQQLIGYYQELVKTFRMIYLEDILSEDDWEGWSLAAARLSSEATIVGDDLIATNPYRLQMAIDKKAITGVVIKPNQIGTVIEALAVVEVARAAGLKVIVSHRSGETNDDFIADFGVAVSADYVKFGAPQRGERIAKYNRLLQIEEELKNMKSE